MAEVGNIKPKCIKYNYSASARLLRNLLVGNVLQLIWNRIVKTSEFIKLLNLFFSEEMFYDTFLYFCIYRYPDVKCISYWGSQSKKLESHSFSTMPSFRRWENWTHRSDLSKFTRFVIESLAFRLPLKARAFFFSSLCHDMMLFNDICWWASFGVH